MLLDTPSNQVIQPGSYFISPHMPSWAIDIVADQVRWELAWPAIRSIQKSIGAGTHSQATKNLIASILENDDTEDYCEGDAEQTAPRVNAWDFIGKVCCHALLARKADQAPISAADVVDGIEEDAWVAACESRIGAMIAAVQGGVDMGEVIRLAPLPIPAQHTLRQPAQTVTPIPRLAASGRLPSIILDGLDGLLLTFVDHVTATARSPQPFLALGAALCAVGAAAGRRYCSETNIRTNPMVIALADSGGGKERPRECLADLFVQARMAQFLGGSRIGSSAGLLTAIKDHPVVLFALDEIGHMLGINAGRNAGAHKAEILPLFTELWSKAGSQYFGTNYGDSKLLPRVILHQPHVVLFGVTVPGVLWKAFGSGALSDGSLARFLVFQTPEDYPDTQRPKLLTMPEQLTDGLRLIAGFGSGNLEGILPQMDATASQEALVVPCDTPAESLLDGISQEELALKRKHQGTSQTAFWARLWEHTVRVAMIRAISRSHAAPTIGADDVRWANALVLHCIENVLSQVNDHVADTPWEASRKAVAAFIRDATGAVSATELTRGLRQIDAKTRAQIISDLVGSGEVIVTAEQNGGRPSKAYTWHG
jgi:hypothetical protein